MFLRSAVVVAALMTGQFHGGITPPKGEHLPPSVAATTPDADHPLKVRIMTVARSQNRFGAEGKGSGNLLGETMVGFNYTYSCEWGIIHNEKPKAPDGDYYQGKWLKQDHKVEILIQQPGSSRVDKCALNVTLLPKPWDRENPPPPAE